MQKQKKKKKRKKEPTTALTRRTLLDYPLTPPPPTPSPSYELREQKIAGSGTTKQAQPTRRALSQVILLVWLTTLII